MPLIKKIRIVCKHCGAEEYYTGKRLGSKHILINKINSISINKDMNAEMDMNPLINEYLCTGCANELIGFLDGKYELVRKEENQNSTPKTDYYHDGINNIKIGDSIHAANGTSTSTNT